MPVLIAPAMTNAPSDIAAQPVRTVVVDDTEYTLLGTAHVSRASMEAARSMVESGAYDAVAVELCPSRHHSLMNPDALARMDLFQVFRQGKVAMVMASLALGAYQQRLAAQLGIEPGAEMKISIEAARGAGLPVMLIDREVGATLKRCWHAVPWWRRSLLLTGLIASVMSRERIDEEEIERLKEGDMLESAFTQFAEEAPEIYAPLITERDRYMAARLRQEAAACGCRRILAVVGAGHLAGLERHLASPMAPPDEVARLEELPPPARWPRLLPWIVVALVLTGFTIGFLRSPDLGLKLVADWVIINGGLSALGAIIAAAHPATVAAALLAAPLTSLNPTVGVGLVTAPVETWLRKPQVGDFAQLRHDTATLAGWWHNRVARVFLVFLFTTIGSAAGTYIAGFRIFGRLMGG